jgi:AAA domain
MEVADALFLSSAPPDDREWAVSRRDVADAVRNRAIIAATEADEHRLARLVGEMTELLPHLDGRAGGSAEDGERLLIDMAEAMKLAEEPIVYAINPLAARGFLTVLVGRHSSYKSWLMLVTGHACHRGVVAQNADPLGGTDSAPPPAKVAELRCEATTTFYLDAENGPRLMGRRFNDAGIPAEGLLVADGTKLRLPRDLDGLRSLIQETGAELVVLDSLRRLTPGIRENESDDMAAVVADIGTLARDLDVAIVLIHHRSTKKGAADVRGSSSIEDQADLVFALERVDGDPDRQRRRLRTVKYRIDEEPRPMWLRMGMVGDCFAIQGADSYEAEPGRPRERDRHRDKVLAQLGDEPRSARRIAKDLDLSKDTVRRILTDLKDEGRAAYKRTRPDGWRKTVLRHPEEAL